MPFVRPEKPGHYYRRMHRGHDVVMNLTDKKVRTQTGLEVQTLCSHLRALFEVITPDRGNLAAYGTRIRQTLVLACTEVETAWAGVLRANSALPEWATTKHYVILADPLELAGYSVRLRDYPSLTDISPFRSWNAANPTKSLPWYDAYNRTKHDREASARDGKLAHAITAVGAMLVMAAAQFGHLLFQPGARFGQTVFQLYAPERPILETIYRPPRTGGRWKAIPYPFERKGKGS